MFIQIDVTTSGQMEGFNDQDGRKQLAIMLVESTLRNGNNCVAEFMDP